MTNRLCFVPLLLALAPAAFGQTIYRSTMPDGRTVLSDRPTPGAKKVEEVYVPPSPPLQRSAPRSPDAGPAREAPSGGATASARKNRDAELDAAITELRKNEDALRAAEAARAAAEEPLENERQGMAGGGSRLNETYFERQKSLADVIEQLRKRVDDAQATVNSLR